MNPENESPAETHASMYSTIEALYKKAETLQYTNFKESIKFFEEGLKKLEGINGGEKTNPLRGKLLTSILRKLTFIHFQSANYQESKYYADMLFDASVSFDDKNAEADAYTSMANIYSDTGQFKEAFEYNTKALGIRSAMNNEGGMAVSYNNLGNILKYENNFDDALEYFLKALTIFEEKNLPQQRSSVLQNIATIYIHQEKYKEALKVLDESIALKRKFGDERGIAYGKHLIGEVHLSSGQYEKAVECFEEAIEIQKRLDDKISLIICYPLLAKALIKMYAKTVENHWPDRKLWQDAESYLEIALNLALKVDSKANLSNIYKDFAEFYEFGKNYELAYKSLKRYCDTAKEVFHENLAQEIMKYKKDIELKEANHIAEINQLRNVELAETIEQLEELNKKKNEFFGIVVHDLKNPIGNIKQLAQFLIDEPEMPDTEKYEFKHAIVNAAETSLELITKLLDDAAIQQGEIVVHITEFDINEEISKVIKLNKTQSTKKSIEIIYENNLKNNFVKTDKSSISHIFDNLISNAIKFSPAGKKIYVKLSQENKFLKMEVRDEGPGFSDEDYSKLFKQYSKLSARPTAGEHSTGLGLSIVKKLTDSLHGTIEVESISKKGTNMIIRVPVH